MKWPVSTEEGEEANKWWFRRLQSKDTNNPYFHQTKKALNLQEVIKESWNAWDIPRNASSISTILKDVHRKAGY